MKKLGNFVIPFKTSTYMDGSSDNFVDFCTICAGSAIYGGFTIYDLLLGGEA
jgi:hypothetical protein